MSYINTTKNNFIFLILITLLSSPVFGQTQEEIKKITANYDLDKLKEKENFYRKKSQADKQKAIAIALEKNWPIRIEKQDGSISELIRISPQGFPIYYSTDNVNAARATRTNHLNSGGSLGLNLDGQGMTARVWDGGNVRATHNAFGGRVEVIDDPSNTSTIQHATHVTGTMIASASPSSIKGMASMATARTFDWFDDTAEALSEVQLGMLISNHSYGTPVSSSPSWYIGAYNQGAQIWDDIAYNAPYYLAVMSAGNDGENNNNTDPIAFGFDKLVGDKVAKNTLVVANALDVTTNTDGTLTVPISINSSSSQGPSDDFRIKPDITGNGTQLTSTSNGTNSATATLTGTSMASPNVAGSLLLLQQHYKNLTNNFMRSATLKGLACHTADDGGEIGPDPTFGWGLLNTKKAAETITGNGLSSWVSEETLNNEQTYTMTVNSNGTSPLIASITWTDLPGNPTNTGIVNDQTPFLINDLDLRISKNSTIYFPWKLTSDPYSPAIRTTDNNLDNVEQVAIDAPTSGQYTISIKHKGTLVTGKQKYSLVVTGISSTFAITSTSDDLIVCSNQNAVYTFNYIQTGSGTTNFSAIDLPVGATVNFSPASLSVNGLVTMTISGLSNIVPNEYLVGIRGTSATETETRYKSLRVFNSNFQPVTLSSPTNGQLGMSTITTLTWVNQPNSLTYTVQVSTFANFSSLLTNEQVTNQSFNIENLSEGTRYYWRVIPGNNCGSSLPNDASIYSFVTGSLVCNLNFVATDYSNAFIDVVPNSEASVPLNISGGYTIGDINVNMAITHTWIGDMIITLEGPASIGSPIITLLENPCGDNVNINCTMDDNGGEPSCSGDPAITGNIAPLESLSDLNTLPADGVWILRVVDPNNEDGGSIDNFSIDLCRIEAVLSVTTNPSMSSSIYPNPTKGIVNVAIPSLTETATIKLFDIQGRQILSRETNQVYTSFGIENLQDGIYLVNIGNDQGSITKKIILRRN